MLNFNRKSTVRSDAFRLPFDESVQLRIGLNYQLAISELDQYAMKFWLLNGAEQKQNVVVKFRWQLLDADRNVLLNCERFSGLCDFRQAYDRKHGYCLRDRIKKSLIDELISTENSLRVRFVIAVVDEKNEVMQEELVKTTMNQTLSEMLDQYYKDIDTAYNKQQLALIKPNLWI